MRLLCWSLGEHIEDGSPTPEERMDAYRDILVEWNDSINRKLALMHVYFGPRLRNQLDSTLGATYVAIGRDLQLMWRSRRSEVNPDLSPDARG